MLLSMGISPTTVAAERQALRIGLTPVFLDNRLSFLRAWGTYLERHLGRPVKFVQRHSYSEVTRLLLNGDLDSAWICGFPYVLDADRLQLVAVPTFRGEPLYQSYLIVPASDQVTSSILELEGKTFVYSDPDSNSGYLVPRVTLLRLGRDPETFFARTFFAWAHHDVIAAVGERLADGGAVDGYVWEMLKEIQPELISRTRVVAKSAKYGFPPLVASEDLPEPDFRALQRVMLQMDQDPLGIALLEELNLDGFILGHQSLYDDIRANLRYLDGP